MADPWLALAARPHLQLLHAPIPERGRYYHDLRTIVLRTGLLLVEQRAVLWHELVHADRGDRQGCSDERTCVRDAARRAIDLHELADALAWSEDRHEVADQLKTTAELLDARLANLHPSERGYLQRRLSMKEHSA